MAYKHKNSKGKEYHLMQKGHLIYFAGDPVAAATKGANAIELPAGATVIENPKTGLPMVKMNK